MSIASLEAELSRQRRINAELRHELSEIEFGVSNGYQTLENCNQYIQNTLNSSREKLEDSRRKGLAAIELQGEIDKLYVRFKQMELANKRIRECNNKKYYEFANYRAVRKLVQGLMDNLNVNMVSDAVIYKSIEAQHLKTPDYWLTCALIAIMAWQNDDRALAERAVSLAVSLDKKSSAIFFMLFNLRVGRGEAAVKWFFVYQECPLKGADQRTFLLLFALMSRCLNESENVSEDTRAEISSFIQKVIQSSISATGYTEADMVAQARAYYDRMDSREAPSYPLLQKYAGRWGELSGALCKAKGNIAILEFLKRTLHVELDEHNAFVQSFMDELVAQANASEKEVYDQIRYNEMIIRCQGDVEQAKAKYQEEQLHEETALNLIAEMIDWIFTADREEVNGQSQKNMFVLTRHLQEKAIQDHTEAYRSTDKVHQPITIGEYSAQADLSAQEQEEQKVSSFFTQRRDEALAAIKDVRAYIAFGLGAVCAVASPFVNWMLLAIAAVCCGYGAIVLFSNRSKRKQIGMNCENQIQSTVDILRHLIQEHKEYLEELAGYDAYIEQIDLELSQI